MKWLRWMVVGGAMSWGLALHTSSSHDLSKQEQEKYLFFEQLLDPTQYSEPFDWKKIGRHFGFAVGAVVASALAGCGTSSLLFHGSSLAYRQEIEEATIALGTTYQKTNTRAEKIGGAVRNFLADGKETTGVCTGAAGIKNVHAGMVKGSWVRHGTAVAAWRAHVFQRILLCAFLITFYVSWQLCAQYKKLHFLSHDDCYQKILKHVLANWPEYRALVPALFEEQFDTLYKIYCSDEARVFFTEENAALIVKTAVMQSLVARLDL